MTVRSEHRDRRRIAGPVGRVLRIGAGVLLLGSIAGSYLNGSAPFIARSVALAALLLVVYLLVHRLLTARPAGLGPWFGAMAAFAPLILMYILGIGDGPLFGAGEGQLAALTFLGASLVLAGLRGDTGCEVMAFPNALTHSEARLVCLIFSPIDRLERPPSRHGVQQ